MPAATRVGAALGMMKGRKIMFMHWTLPAMVDRRCAEKTSVRGGTVAAAADILDDGESYELVVEMPGVTQDNLKLDLEKGTLIVRGERNGYSEKERVLYNGRHAGRAIEKRFSIGEDVDRSGVKAVLENGLLRVTLPRKAEEKSRKIEIEVK
jgi:HSP20 family molecular chaperone IbpA